MIEIIKALVYLEDYYASAYAYLSQEVAANPLFSILMTLALLNCALFFLRAYFLAARALEQGVMLAARLQLRVIRFSVVPAAVAGGLFLLYSAYSSGGVSGQFPASE